jgi:hypothetical protein
MAQMDQEEQFDLEEARQEIARDLPEGVELADVNFSMTGLKTEYLISFKFDHVDILSQVTLSNPDEQDPGEENPIEEPFSDLKFVDEGNTLLLTSSPLNPMPDEDELAQMPMASDDMMASLFESLRVAFSVETPFEVVEHNATRVEGRKLIWEYTLNSFKEGAGSEAIKARFRK